MRLCLKLLLLSLIAGAATFVAPAQASFEKTYRFSINYSSNEVTITGVCDGVKLQGDIQIPGSYTSTRDGVKYTVTSLRSDIGEVEFGMGRPVFENQDEITSIYIPSTIDDILVGSFSGCKRLKEFKVSSQNKTFKAVDGVLYYLRGEDYVDMMRFPPARTSTGFTLPDEAGCILEGAFADNYTITTLRLSKWQQLMPGALDGNLGITRFELNGHYLYETNAGGDYLVEKDDPGVLLAVAPRYKMGDLLAIPSTIHTILWYALAGNRAKSISIPSSVKYIGSYAFTGSSLESVSIPATVTDIPKTEGLFYNCQELKTATIAAPIKSIGDFMFMGCPKLESVTLPNACKSIGASAFVGCGALREFSGLYRFPVVDLEVGCQFAQSGLTTANIPTAWAILPQGMFKGCESMTSVTLSDGVATVGESTFEGASLETVNTKNVNHVDQFGFATAATLRKVVIPAHDGTMTLGYKAFLLAPSAEIYIDHKSMAAAMEWDDWHDMFEYPADALPKIYTSKRSFSRFFTNFDELYVPAGSRAHYKGLCAAGSACRDRIYEMFSYSAVDPSKAEITVTPVYNWVKITSVTINGIDASLSGGVWSAPGAASAASTMNVVIGYTANNIKMSTEYNLQASSGLEDAEAYAAEVSRIPKAVIYRQAASREGAVYYDMQGRQVISPCEGGIYITF